MSEDAKPPVPADDSRPQPPREPEPYECCGGGCMPCVYDVYWEKLARYEELLQEWEARHGAGGNS